MKGELLEITPNTPPSLQALLMQDVVVDLGSVTDRTLGNSASGNGDANSQYYW